MVTSEPELQRGARKPDWTRDCVDIHSPCYHQRPSKYPGSGLHLRPGRGLKVKLQLGYMPTCVAYTTTQWHLSQTAAEYLVWVHGPTAVGSVTVSMTSDTTEGHTDARGLGFNTLLMSEGCAATGVMLTCVACAVPCRHTVIWIKAVV